MKKTLLVLLVPFMALANPITETQNELFASEISTEITYEFNNDEHLLPYKFKDNTTPFKLIMEKTIENIEVFQGVMQSNQTVTTALPKSLNTFSLTGMYDYENMAIKPLKRLNSLLAANDPEYPKVNTFLKNFNSVPDQKYQFSGDENIAVGFGPRISL
jgi:hypothetical protein